MRNCSTKSARFERNLCPSRTSRLLLSITARRLSVLLSRKGIRKIIGPYTLNPIGSSKGYDLSDRSHIHPFSHVGGQAIQAAWKLLCATDNVTYPYTSKVLVALKYRNFLGRFRGHGHWPNARRIDYDERGNHAFGLNRPLACH